MDNRAPEPYLGGSGTARAMGPATLAAREGSCLMVTPVALSVFDVSTFTMRPAPDDGHAAWLSVAAEVDARVGTPVTVVNIELQEAAERALHVLERLHGNAALYPLFKRLASAQLFDFGALTRTRTLAWALWHARHQQKLAELAPAWKVAQDTVEEATDLRTKMARLAKYHLETHPDEGPLVRSVTSDRGRRRIANDLELLSGVYRRQRETLAGDRYYEAANEARAHELATEILLSLGKEEREEWTDRCAVLWTMLLAAYKEVRDTGRWLLRDRPDEALAQFPGLVPQRKGAGAKDAAEGDEAAEAAGEAPGETAAPAVTEPKPAAAPTDAAPPADAAQPAQPKPADTKPSSVSAKKPAARSKKR